MTKEAFVRHMKEELGRPKPPVAARSVGCVDPKTDKGEFNYPGGGFFLEDEYGLENYLETQRRLGVPAGGVPIYVHVGCGYLYAVKGLIALEEQWRYLGDFVSRVLTAARKKRVEVRMIIQTDGSAPCT